MATMLADRRGVAAAARAGSFGCEDEDMEGARGADLSSKGPL